VGIEHLEPQNLKGEWNQFGQIRDMGILLMKQRENILRQVFCMVSRYT